jgi:hypothetical protein
VTQRNQTGRPPHADTATHAGKCAGPPTYASARAGGRESFESEISYFLNQTLGAAELDQSPIYNLSSFPWDLRCQVPG